MPDVHTRVDATVVTSSGCHLCADALAALDAVNDVVAVRSVDSGSEEGRALLAEHRPALLPLVVVEGSTFSAGRLPRGKLRRLLEERRGG